MTSLAVKHEPGFTWADYQSWPDDERWEIIGGKAFAMSPSPGIRHQDIVINMARELSLFFKGKTCRPFTAPLDVKLSEYDVVQPDLMVVCEPKQFQGTHIEGAPRLVVEIASPSSVSHDRLAKMRLYQLAGVEEYWIVTPYPPMVEIFRLESGHYHLHAGGTQKDSIASAVFPDLKLNLAEVFDIAYTAEEMKIFEVRESPARYAEGSSRSRGA